MWGYTKKQIAIGTACALAVGGFVAWYNSDLADYEHHRNSICPPQKDDPEERQYFKNSKGLWLYTRHWGLDIVNPRARVFIIHGYGEHSGRAGYAYVAEALVDRGYSVHSMDHQGHGKSNGTQGHVKSHTDFLDDIEAFIERVQLADPSLPCILLGHSMGGALVLATVAFRKVTNLKGIALSAPAINLHADPNYSEFSRQIGKAICPLLPKMTIIPAISASEISRSTEACSLYSSDPLVRHEGVRLSIGQAMINLSIDLSTNLGILQIPTYIMHGGADKVVDPSASRIIHDSISSKKKKVTWYENMKHELFEDPEREGLVEDMLNWIDGLLD